MLIVGWVGHSLVGRGTPNKSLPGVHVTNYVQPDARAADFDKYEVFQVVLNSQSDLAWR